MTFKRLEYWVIPPKEDEEFVAAMENILEIYKRPYDNKNPVICMDEQPIQFFKHVYQPIPESSKHGPRVDYEYQRNGTGNVMMFVEPLGCWRHVITSETKTKKDWAQSVREIQTKYYPNADKITLICDNLNTHTYGAFYKTFPPDIALQMCQSIKLEHTPKHGSWLNIAENELSALTRQCTGDRRIEDMSMLKRETAAWCENRNDRQKGVDWQFAIGEARMQLKSLYPNVILNQSTQL